MPGPVSRTGSKLRVGRLTAVGSPDVRSYETVRVFASSQGQPPWSDRGIAHVAHLGVYHSSLARSHVSAVWPRRVSVALRRLPARAHAEHPQLRHLCVTAHVPTAARRPVRRLLRAASTVYAHRGAAALSRSADVSRAPREVGRWHRRGRSTPP